MTGGRFGPENSILTITLVSAVLVAVLRWARRHGRLRPARIRLGRAGG